MKPITLAVAALALAVTTAGAQDPTPPARPVPTRPAPVTPRTPRAPRPQTVVSVPIDRDFDFDFDFELEHVHPFTVAAVAPVEVNVPPIDVHVPSFDVHAPGIDVNVGSFGRRDFTDRMPPAPWAQGDPADSLYRVAREALMRGDYGRAARMFGDLVQKYPKSVYFSNAQYYEALARYKVGTTDDLKQAARILEPIAKPTALNTASTSGSAVTVKSFRESRRGADDSEIAALYARVNGALAQRGDADAAKKINLIVTQAGSAPCDQEDIQVRTEALNALSQMDPASATPILRRVVERKDDCSASLRRSAVFMLGRRADADAATTLIGVAKSDPNSTVRVEAINFLPRMPGDAALSALEEILRSDQDERIQRAAVRALMSSDNQKARSSMRSLIDRKDAPMALRIEAVNSLSGDRGTTEDAAYLRSLYSRADSDRLKEAIISAVSRMGGSENDQWVLGIVRNPNEPSALRSAALSRYSRSSTVSIADLAKLYDTADSYDLRSRVVAILGNRKEPEATDKLIDIAKTSTVVSLRKEAINALARKNDARTTQLLLDIVDGKKP